MQFLIGFILGFGLAFVMFYKPAREWFKGYLKKQRAKNQEEK